MLIHKVHLNTEDKEQVSAAMRTVAASFGLEQTLVLLKSIHPPATSTVGLIVYIWMASGFYRRFGDARSDHHLLGRSSKKACL